MPPDRPQRRWALSWVVGGSLFVVAHAAAALSGGNWWGLHHLRYLDVATGLAAIVASLGVAAAIVRGVPRLPALVAGVAAFPVLWLLRDRSHWLGDGSVILARVGDPIEFHEREPLSALLNDVIASAAPRIGLDPTSALELISCLFGVAFVTLLVRLDRNLGAKGAAFALVFFVGTVQLFFGYVENYPSVALVIVMFLVAARAPATKPRSLLPAVLLFELALFLHISSAVLAPALGFLIVRQLVLRTGPGPRAMIAAELAGAAVVAGLAWPLVFQRVDGAGSLFEYLSILGDASRYSYDGIAAEHPGIAPPFWSREHVSEWLNLQLLLVPVALPLVIAGAVRRPRALVTNGWAAFLAVASVAYLGAQYKFFPGLGAPRDWDALAVGALPIALLAVALLPQGRAIAAVLGALAAFHTIPWILVNAIPSAAQARFEEVPMPGGQTSFVIGLRAMKEGDLDEAILRLERATRDVPEATPSWYSLGRAYEQSGRPEDARDAYLRVLSLLEKDPRAPRSEVLERLGMIDWQAGRVDHARLALEEALRENPGSIVARVFLSYAALDEGRGARVLELLGPILDRRGENPAILVLHGRALIQLGRTEEAAAVLAEAAQRFPDDGSVRSARRELDGGR